MGLVWLNSAMRNGPNDPKIQENRGKELVEKGRRRRGEVEEGGIVYLSLFILHRCCMGLVGLHNSAMRNGPNAPNALGKN